MPDLTHAMRPLHPCHASTPTREDEYDVNFVYGPDASNGDITKRHIEPLVKKALEGYNTCVYTFGATGVCWGGGQCGLGS